MTGPKYGYIEDLDTGNYYGTICYSTKVLYAIAPLLSYRTMFNSTTHSDIIYCYTIVLLTKVLYGKKIVKKSESRYLLWFLRY